MGLALCHRVPRDGVLLLSMLLVFAACVLQAIVIGHHSTIVHVGSLARNNGDGNDDVLAYIAAHAAVYGTPAATTSDAYRKLCDPSSATLRRACARFAEAYHAVNGLVVASFVASVLTLLCGLFVFTALSRTTTGLLRRLLFIVSVPATLQCAAVGVFFAQVVPHAKMVVVDVVTTTTTTASAYDVDTRVVPSTAGVAFHRAYVANVAIVAVALLGTALLLTAARLCYALHTSYAPTPLYLVNDDWQRQKHVLRTHARSVQLELRIMEQQPGEASASNNNSSSGADATGDAAAAAAGVSSSRTDDDSHGLAKPMYSNDSSHSVQTSNETSQQQQQQQQQQQAHMPSRRGHVDVDAATGVRVAAATTMTTGAVHGFAFRHCAGASVGASVSVIAPPRTTHHAAMTSGSGRAHVTTATTSVPHEPIKANVSRTDATMTTT